jgi:chromosome segregation ATPase
MYWLYNVNDWNSLQEENERLKSEIEKMKTILFDKNEMINQRNNEIMNLKMTYSKMNHLLNRLVFETSYLVEKRESIQNVVTLIDNIEKIATTKSGLKMATKSGLKMATKSG